MERVIQTLGSVSRSSSSICQDKKEGQVWKQQICLGVFDYPQEEIFSPRLKLLEKDQNGKIDVKDQSKTNQHIAQQCVQQIKHLVGDNMKITQIWSFKTNLSQYQLTNLFLYHEYIVFKTENNGKFYFWNIEKNMERIWMSLSKNFEEARDYQHYAEFQNQGTKTSKFVLRFKNQRQKPVKLKSSKANYEFKQFIKWIYEQDFRNEKYNFFQRNCQHFASKIYDKVTSHK